ncbi:hypothetical protein E3U43_021012, partial [Larimichthys crocea]
GNRGRQGGVDRLTKPALSLSFILFLSLFLSLFLFSHSTECLQSYVKQPLGSCLWSGKPGPPLLFSGTNRYRENSPRRKRQKQTWGDNKETRRCCDPTMTLWEDP